MHMLGVGGGVGSTDSVAFVRGEGQPLLTLPREHEAVVNIRWWRRAEQRASASPRVAPLHPRTFGKARSVGQPTSFQRLHQSQIFPHLDL